MKKAYRIPFFLLCFAIYPGLSLLAWNIREVDWQIVIRPLLVTILFLLFILFFIQVLTRDWNKSSLLTVLVLFITFSYGHASNFILNSTPIGKPNRYLLIFYVILFVFFVWLVLYRINDWHKAYSTLNWVSVILVVLTMSQIVIYELKDEKTIESNVSLTKSNIDQFPDIYYIILDGYNRADLLKEMGYDNSEFINFLQSGGFYVADCSRSNYRKTMLSVASTLNMDYVYNFIPNDGYNDTNTDPVIKSIRNNRVRAELKSLGYTDIAFNMGYKWATWWDADLYLPELNRFTAYLGNPNPNSFEVMYIRTTILSPLIDRKIININTNLRFFSQDRGHYERVHYVLDKLSELVTYPGPKLVYAHLIVPHSPYVFLPDGSYDRNQGKEIGTDGLMRNTTRGYFNNLEFINNRMKILIDDIISESKHPSIIVIQADHSLVSDSDDRRFNILNAYYLPEGGESVLYPTITPVNTFRIIFNQYFGANFPLLNDKSITSDIGHPYSTIEARVTSCPVD